MWIFSRNGILRRYHFLQKEMGEVASVLKACSCSDMAKYVCNAMHLHSKCSDCCDIEFETTEVHVGDGDDSEYEIEVIGCCTARHG